MRFIGHCGCIVTFSDFQRDTDFSILMAGANRKPPVEIGAPSLIQHRAFWMPQASPSRADWIVSIERMILDFYDTICAIQAREFGQYLTSPNIQLVKESTGTSSETSRSYLYLLDNYYPEEKAVREQMADAHRKPIHDYPNRYQTVRFGFSWRSINTEVSFELHTEYFTLSVALDFCTFRAPKKSREVICLEGLTRMATQRLDSLKDPNADATVDAKAERRLVCCYNVLYTLIWEKLFRDFFSAQTADAARVGSIFADFRGLVLTKDRDGIFVCPVKVYNDKNRVVETASFSDSDGGDVRCVDAILPFMRVGLGVSPNRFGQPPEPNKLVEYTFSKFHNRRAIYGSALGFQSYDVSHRTKPLTFIILATHGDRWQLGRLVDEILTLGTLRLAALYDLPRIVEANSELRAVENELLNLATELPGTMKTLDDLQRLEDSEDTEDPEIVEDELRKRRTDHIQRVSIGLNKAWQKFTQISLGGEHGISRNAIRKNLPMPRSRAAKKSSYSQRLVWNVKHLTCFLPEEPKPARAVPALDAPSSDRKSIRGGLAYRVERSRYYRQQFNILVKAAGIERVGGFQPYDKFVERRLGATYDLINMVGLRLIRLQQLITAFSRQTTSSELLVLQDKITGEAGAIERLQAGAEIAFFAFLFPYYTSQVLLTLLRTTEAKPRLPLNLKAEALIVCAAIVGGSCYAAWKFMDSKIKPAWPKILLMALLGFIFVNVALSITPRINPNDKLAPQSLGDVREQH
jgi:hypothetical protein